VLHRHATVRNAGAQQGDVDINRQQISISESRYLGFEAATETAASERLTYGWGQYELSRLKEMGAYVEARALFS